MTADSIHPSSAEIREQLARLLCSDEFSRAARLRRFLEFIVEEVLQGRAAGLTEQPIAWQLYEGKETFDASSNAAVRVDAHRLRGRLLEYYVHHPEDELIISLPKGGYVPLFQIRTFTADNSSTRAKRSLRRQWRSAALAAGVAALAVIVAAVFLRHDPLPARQQAPGSRTVDAAAPSGLSVPVPLTSYVGHETHPAFSPDGSQVVFSWVPEGAEAFRLHVKVLGEDRAVPLTHGPGSDVHAAWAPDGRWIAFIRWIDDRPKGYLVPPLGGEERLLVENAADVDWMPDSRHVAVEVRGDTAEGDAIALVGVETMTMRYVTRPGRVAVDGMPRVAPDGELIAFRRCRTRARQNCDIYLVPTSGTADATRLTSLDHMIDGLDWTPDGRGIVFSDRGELWKVGIDEEASGKVVKLGVAGSWPTLGQRGGKVQLAYRSTWTDSAIHRVRFTLARSGEPTGIAGSERLINSTRGDSGPEVSPDGNTIAFISDRDGSPGVWLADADGERVRHVVSGRIDALLTWAPDGGRLAGLCGDDGDDGNDICIVDIVTRQVERIAPSPHYDGMATWSADGQDLYFLSTRSGLPAIWRTRPGSEMLEQVTEHPAILVTGAMGRDEYYYVPDPSLSAENWVQELWALDVPERRRWRVLERFYPFALAASRTGFYWFDYEDRDRPPTVRYRSNATGEKRDLGRLPFMHFESFPEFSVDPFDRYLLMAVAEDARSDLWIIEDWR
jgi:Tol biopolymer transport system component